MTDARDEAQMRVLLTRGLTRAGNYPNLAVGLAAASITVAFTLDEIDTKYGVKVTPNWNTSVWVTNKATTDCVVHFGTVAPADATIDVSTFRSEEG